MEKADRDVTIFFALGAVALAWTIHQLFPATETRVLEFLGAFIKAYLPAFSSFLH